MLSLILSSESEKEIENAYKWYENKRIGLGNEFMHCLDATLHSISRNPKLFQNVYKNIRRAIVRRFPFCIFFIEERKNIKVLAVFNANRNPSEWKKRKNFE